MPPRRAAPLLIALLALPGCEAAIGPAAIAGGASLIFIGRTPVDVLASAVTGKDCSAVHIERREPWCLDWPGPPPPPAYCTPSLGWADCWTGPPPGNPRGLADPPARPAQVAGGPAAPAAVAPTP